VHHRTRKEEPLALAHVGRGLCGGSDDAEHPSAPAHAGRWPA
jgi:hypothetical protein